MKLSNLYKNNPKKVKKAMLAFKGFIGAISVATIFQTPLLSAVFLIAGAFIEFLVDLIFSDENVS
jgi:hypothetical protein